MGIHAEDSVIFCHSTAKKSKAKNIKTWCITVLFFVHKHLWKLGLISQRGAGCIFFTRICSNIGATGFFNNGGCHVCTKQTAPLLLTEEILHQLIGSFSHYLQGFQVIVWDFFHDQYKVDFSVFSLKAKELQPGFADLWGLRKSLRDAAFLRLPILCADLF